MAGIKGKPNPNAGRRAGIPNKATTQAREAIALFVEGNVDRLNGWLDAIALDSPKDAFDRFMSVVEYHVPKLQRMELANPHGETFDVRNISESDEAILKRHEDFVLKKSLETENKT